MLRNQRRFKRKRPKGALLVPGECYLAPRAFFVPLHGLIKRGRMTARCWRSGSLGLECVGIWERRDLVDRGDGLKKKKKKENVQSLTSLAWESGGRTTLKTNANFRMLIA